MSYYTGAITTARAIVQNCATNKMQFAIMFYGQVTFFVVPHFALYLIMHC